MAARDYRELAPRVAGPSLAGEPIEALWDPALAPAMREAGAALFEEQIADLLIRDLAEVFQRAPDTCE